MARLPCEMAAASCHWRHRGVGARQHQHRAWLRREGQQAEGAQRLHPHIRHVRRRDRFRQGRAGSAIGRAQAQFVADSTSGGPGDKRRASQSLRISYNGPGDRSRFVQASRTKARLGNSGIRTLFRPARAHPIFVWAAISSLRVPSPLMTSLALLENCSWVWLPSLSPSEHDLGKSRTAYKIKELVAMEGTPSFYLSVVL